MSEPVNDEIDQAMRDILGDDDYLYTEKPYQIRKLITQATKEPDISKVDRFEVIDETGRAYVRGSIYGTPVKVELSFQDDGKTLKVFISEVTNE